MTARSEMLQLSLQPTTADLHRYRMLNWTVVLVDHLQQKFAAAAVRGIVAAFRENLYVQPDLDRRSLTLAAGNHPVGNSLKGSGLAVEGGAALTVSQAVDGSVAVFLYPFKSELMRRKEDNILWALFKGPDDVTKRTIDRAIADAARYWRVSSALDGGSRPDRLRVDYLVLRAQLREAIARRSWIGKLVKIGVSLVAVISFLSAIATLAGTSVPQLWSRMHPSADAGMPVTAGWYTFCPQDGTGASPKLLDLLYDIRQNAGKVAFFDVQVDVACVMGTAFDPAAAVSRKAEERSLTYSFGPGQAGQNDTDGERPPMRPGQLVAENGAFVTVLDDRDVRNALTRLGINAEGVDDELYGPYLIKADGEDAALTLTLSAPTLDSTMQDAATAIAAQRRAAHENDPPPNGVPQPIKLSAADLQRLQALAISPAASTASGVRPPTALPPLDDGSLGRLPPLPTPLPAPHPASLPGVQAGSQ